MTHEKNSIYTIICALKLRKLGKKKKRKSAFLAKIILLTRFTDREFYSNVTFAEIKV